MTLSFPVIRGVQAGREYYVAMWTLKTLRQISIFDESDLPPELRAQRIINKGRIPEMSNYVTDNPKDYIFSALTVSIDSEVDFKSLEGDEKLGVLRVPMDAKFIINDGQHRRAAIMAALEESPHLAYETIAVVFYLDVGLKRSQQMFADLNRYAIRPSRSLGLLYDHRNEKALLAKQVVQNSEIFRDIVDMEKSSLSPRSHKLFTLSAFYNCCAELISEVKTGELEKDAKLVGDYWKEVAEFIPQWELLRKGKITAGGMREDYIHAHGIGLQSLSRAGKCLLLQFPKDWPQRLKGLNKIDWSRKNVQIWEGRAMVNGRLSKASQHITLTSNYIKNALDLPFSEEEAKIEKTFLESNT